MAFWRWLKKCLRRSKSTQTTKLGHQRSMKKRLINGRGSRKVKHTNEITSKTINTPPPRPKRPSTSSTEADSLRSEQHSHNCVCPDQNSSNANPRPVTCTIPQRRGAIISLPSHRRRTINRLNARKRPVVQHTLPVRSYYAQIQRILQQHDGISCEDAPNGIASAAEQQHVTESKRGDVPEGDDISHISSGSETSYGSFHTAKSFWTSTGSATTQTNTEGSATPTELVRADECSTSHIENRDSENALDVLVVGSKPLPALPAHAQPRPASLAPFQEHPEQHRGWLAGHSSCSPTQLQPISANGIMSGRRNENEIDEDQSSETSHVHKDQAMVTETHNEQPNLELFTTNAFHDDCIPAPVRPASPSPTIQMSRQLHPDPNSPASSRSLASLTEDNKIGTASSPTTNLSTPIAEWAAYLSWSTSSSDSTSSKSTDTNDSEVQAHKNAELLLALPFASSSLLLSLPPQTINSQSGALTNAQSEAACAPMYDSDSDEGNFTVLVKAGIVP